MCPGVSRCVCSLRVSVCSLCVCVCRGVSGLRRVPVGVEISLSGTLCRRSRSRSTLSQEPHSFKVKVDRRLMDPLVNYTSTQLGGSLCGETINSETRRIEFTPNVCKSTPKTPDRDIRVWFTRTGCRVCRVNVHAHQFRHAPPHTRASACARARLPYRVNVQYCFTHARPYAAGKHGLRVCSARYNHEMRRVLGLLIHRI